MDDIRHGWALDKLNMIEAITTSTALAWSKEGDHSAEGRVQQILDEAMGER